MGVSLGKALMLERRSPEAAHPTGMRSGCRARRKPPRRSSDGVNDRAGTTTVPPVSGVRHLSSHDCSFELGEPDLHLPSLDRTGTHP